MIEAKSISKFFSVINEKGMAEGLAAVLNISLTIPDGRIVTLLGPSGCGKSTFLEILAGLQASTDGEIVIDGKRVLEPLPSTRKEMEDYKRRYRFIPPLANGVFLDRPKHDIAMIFQDYAVFPWMTVVQNVIFALKLRNSGKARLSKKELYEKARYYLNLVDLGSVEYKYPSQLSGGMRQRLALARAPPHPGHRRGVHPQGVEPFDTRRDYPGNQRGCDHRRPEPCPCRGHTGGHFRGRRVVGSIASGRPAGQRGQNHCGHTPRFGGTLPFDPAFGSGGRVSPALLAIVLGFPGCRTGKGTAQDLPLEAPPVITPATYQHTLYNGKPQPIEAKANREGAPLAITHFASLEALERDEGGTAEPPVAVGDYYARIERPAGGGFAAGRAIAVEYHVQKALVAIAAADKQQLYYDGLPETIAVSVDQPVPLTIAYYAAGSAAALDGLPVDPGDYVAKISFGGNANYLGASKDVVLSIVNE
jgi:ABC-type nitrate/sulfonate/bicarbonate transport system ATPase subunit